MFYKMRRYLAVALAVAMVVTCLPFGLLVRADGQKIYYLYVAGQDDEGDDIYDVTTEYPDDGSLMGIYVDGGTYDFEEKGGILIANNAVVNVPLEVVSSGNVEYRLAGDGQIVTDFGIISTNEEAYTGEITYDALRTRFFSNNEDGHPAAPAYNLRVTADLELDSSMRIDELVVDKDVTLSIKAGGFEGYSQAVTVSANSAVINGTLEIQSAPDGSFGLNCLYINESGNLTVAQSGKITGALGTLIEMRGGSSFAGLSLYKRNGDSIISADQGDEARYLYDEAEDKWIADHAYNSDKGFFAIGFDDRRNEMNNPEAYVKLDGSDVIPYGVYHYEYVEGMKMTFTLIPPEELKDTTPIVEDSYGSNYKVTKNGDDYILEFTPGPEGFNLEVYWSDFEALNPDESQVLFDVEWNGSVFYTEPSGTIIDSKQDPFNMNHVRYLVDCSSDEDITLRFSAAEGHSVDAFYYNWARYDGDNIEDLLKDHREFTFDDQSNELVYTLIRENLDWDRAVFFVIEADDAEFGPVGPHFSEGEYGVFFNDWGGDARVMMGDADLISGYYGCFEEGDELTFVLIPPKSREAETPVVRIRRENIEDMESTLDGLTITQLDPKEHTWEFKYTPETTEGFIVDVEWSEYDILGPSEGEFMIEFNSNSGFASFETDPNPKSCVPEPGENGLNGRGNKMTFIREDIKDSGIDLKVTLKEGSKIEVIRTLVNDVENEYVPNDRELPEGDGGRKHMSDCDWFSEKDGVLTISIPGDLEDNFVWIDIEYEGEYGPGPDGPSFHDNEMQVFYDDRGGEARVELGGEFVGSGWFGSFESGDEFTFTLRSPEVRWGETPVVRIRQESGIRSTEGDDGLNPVTPVDADKHVWEFTYTADGDEGFIVDIEWSVYDTYGAGPDEFAIEIENNPEFGEYAVTTGYGGSMPEPNGGRCKKFIFDRESVKDSGMATEFTPVSIDAIDTIWIDYGNFNYGFVADGRELEEGDNRQYMSECEWISVNDGVITVTLPLPEEKEDNYARIHIEYYGDHGDPGPEGYFPEDGKFFVNYDMRENPDTHQPEATVVLGDSVLRSCDEYDFEAEKEMTFTLNPPVDRVGEVIRVDIQGSDSYHYATDEQDEANRIVVSDGQFKFTPPSGEGFKIYVNWSAYDSFGPTAEEVMVQIGPDASGGDYTISPAAKPENIMTEPCGGNGIKYLYNRNEVPDGITVVITPKEGYAIDNIGFDGEDYILDGREKDPEDTRKYISECDQITETDGVVTVTIPGDEERNMMYLGFNFYEDGGHDEPQDTGELRINAGDAGVEYAFVKDGVTGEYADYSSNYGFDDPLIIDPENEPDQILIKFVPAGEEELKNPVRISVEYSGRPSINEVRKMPADNIIVLEKNDGWGVCRIDFADEGSMTNNEYKIRVVGSDGYDPLVDKEAEKIYTYEKDETIVLDLGENVPAYVTADVNFGSVQTIERGTDGKYSFVPENTAGFVVSIYETEEDLNYERTVPGPEEMSLNYRTYYRDYPEDAAHKSGIGYETDPNASATNGSGEMSVVILDENTSSFTFVINTDADECRDVRVNVNGVDVTDQITDGKFVFDFTEYGNMTEPVFEFYYRRTYSITAPAVTGGTTDVAASAKEGTEVTVTATPSTGYELSGITVKTAGNVDVDVTDGKFIMPSDDVTVTATFKKTDYTVTAGECQNGSVSVDKTTANYGDVITVTATPAEGYELDTVKVDGTAIAGTTFTMPAKDVTVTATFKKTDYTVTVAETQNGTVTVSKTTANMGDEITLTITSATGYELDTLSVTGATVTDGKFTMPASDVTVTATFKKTDYTVTVAETQNGTVTVSKTTANMGDEITVTVTPATGYELDTLSVTGATVTDGKFTMPAKDVSVTATFKKTDYTVTAGECQNGSVSVDKATANYGDVITVTATPATGYELDTVKVDGTAIAGTTFTMPAKDVTVTATFKKTDYTVTVAETQNGTVTVSKATANMGDEITVTVTPATGYELDTLSVTGATVTDGKFTMPAKNVTVTATFKKTDYTITIGVCVNGSVSVSQTTANYGDVILVTATPDAGYELIYFQVDGGDYAGTAFNMPAKNVTVTATFRKADYGVSVGQVQNGTVTVSKTTANYGDEITVTATPATGYELDTVKVDGTAISGTTFTMPAKNVTVTAVFKEIPKTYTVSLDYDSSMATVSGIAASTTAHEGDKYTFKVTPVSGYKITSVKANDTVLSADSSGNYKTTQPASDLVIKVTCEQIPVTYDWVKIGGKWYYIDSNGNKTTGFATIKGVMYFFDASGAMKTGWISEGGKWYYADKSGALQTEWKQISKVWYYFGTETGEMFTGVQKISGVLYWFKDSGALAKGWYKNEDGTYYYFTTDGAVTGWKQISKVWYYFDKSTALMVTGIQKIDGKYYIFESSGAMQKSGWKQVGEDWYYLNKGGDAYVNRWLSSGNKWYYFKEDGRMACNESLEIKGKTYEFDSTGAMK